MKKPKRIILTGAPVTAEEIAKDLGLSKREQREIGAAVARILASEVSPARKTARRSASRSPARNDR
ncbi:MAG: hypothetical protein ACYDCL_11975 [Myxococcales bacterium]